MKRKPSLTATSVLESPLLYSFYEQTSSVRDPGAIDLQGAHILDIEYTSGKAYYQEKVQLRSTGLIVGPSL